MSNHKLLQKLNTLKFTYPKIIRSLVESFFNLTDFTDYSSYGAVFCCFHEDKNKPSAKLFQDDDGVERLYCFAERRQYTSYDYLKLIMGKDPLVYLVSNISELELTYAIEDYVKNAGKLESRKSKIDKELTKEMKIGNFIKYLCFGKI